MIAKEDSEMADSEDAKDWEEESSDESMVVDSAELNLVVVD